jgi:hypothetical protein
METFLLKLKYKNSHYLTFLVDSYLEHDFSEKNDNLLKSITEETLLTVSVSGYSVDNAHGGHYPQEISNILSEKISTRDFIDSVNRLDEQKVLDLDMINISLVEGMLISAEHNQQREKIEILSGILNKI